MTHDVFKKKFSVAADELLLKLKQLRQSEGSGQYLDYIQLSEENIIAIKDRIEQHTMPFSRGAQLGINRFLSEWAPSDICDLGRALDRLYQNATYLDNER